MKLFHDLLLLDVTIRDGGYVNGHTWTLSEATDIVRAVAAAGIPYVEVGYLRSLSGEQIRPSARCAPDYLEALANHAGRTGLAVMVRPGEVDVARLATVGELGVKMVRVLVPNLDVDRASPYIAEGRAAGMIVTANLTRVSEAEPKALAEAARRCAEAGADLVYLADSNGSLFPDAVRTRVETLAAATDVPIGFHAHDNLGLAFINTCAAVDAGAVAVDASIAGIGKGGGNLRLELIVAHWVLEHGVGYRLDPLVRNRTTFAAQLRMLAEGASGSLVAGLLDVNLDQAAVFEEEVALQGFDALLRRDDAHLAATS